MTSRLQRKLRKSASYVRKSKPRCSVVRISSRATIKRFKKFKFNEKKTWMLNGAKGKM